MTVDLETGTRGRTRRAILDAAVRVLAADPGASLGQIADAADVGRTTLHRYFPDRAELLAALTQEAARRLTDAGARARLDEGPGLDALLRACQACLQLGDLLTLLFTEVVSLEACGDEDGFSRALDAACARGLADGTLDTRLTPGLAAGHPLVVALPRLERAARGHDARRTRWSDSSCSRSARRSPHRPTEESDWTTHPALTHHRAHDHAPGKRGGRPGLLRRRPDARSARLTPSPATPPTDA